MYGENDAFRQVDMTVHHDKSVYGKLHSLESEATEDELLEMVRALQEGEMNEKSDVFKWKEKDKSAAQAKEKQ